MSFKHSAASHLAIMLGMMGVCLWRQRRFVQTYQRVRQQPISLNLSFQEATPVAEKQKRLVIVGDSRARAWQMPKLAGWQVLNRGVNGATARQVLLRLGQDVLPLKPQIALVQVGVNDLWRLGVFNSAEKAQIIANVKQTITTITNQLIAQNCHVILSTIFPLGNIPMREKIWGTNATTAAITQINNFIKQQASPTITIFDTAPRLTNGNQPIATHFQADYLHLNQTGYDHLNTHLLPLLKK